MGSETERKTYQEIEKARLFDRVIGSATRIHERYETIWSRAQPHWTDARLILDIGTGPARLLGFLAMRLPKTKFIGLDIAEPMLVVAEENLKKMDLLSRVKLMCQDCTQLPFDDGSVSGVLSTGTYTARLYEVDRHPDYKKRFDEGIKHSPRKIDIEATVAAAAISGLRLTFDPARFVIEINKGRS